MVKIRETVITDKAAKDIWQIEAGKHLGISLTDGRALIFENWEGDSAAVILGRLEKYLDTSFTDCNWRAVLEIIG